MQDVFLSAAGEIDRLETVLDSLSMGVLVCDTSHNLILANKYALRLLPINSVEKESEPIWNLISQEKVAAFLEKTLKSGDKVEDWEFDVDIYGKMRLFSISVWPMVKKKPGNLPEVTGSLIHVVDITEKRSREARMRRVESLASLTTLAAGVAHEIKNPLGSLSIHVQLVQKALEACRVLCGGEKANLDTIDRYLSVINEEIERLNQIVVDFLFAVRPMDLDLRYGNINTLLKELADFVCFELNEKSIDCNLDLAEDLPAINYDENAMKQAILNIVQNAIAAMPEGGELYIKTDTQDTDIRISIADTGVGIPEENFMKIFEPYFTTKVAGSGLGLTMVFKIVREHSGEINVFSRPGEGSVFTITLPVPQKETRLIGAPE